MNKAEKCSESQKGRIVIHKGDVEKRVYPSELETYLQSGWERGVSDRHRESNSSCKKGKPSWNKGTKGATGRNRTSFKKGCVPWNKGLKGKQTSWNKGLTKETDSRLNKSSHSLKEAWKNAEKRREEQSERARKLFTGRKLSESELESFLDKNYITRKNNNTFNTSEPEELYYKSLCDTYGAQNVKRQYRDKKRYPFRCDFYIISEDIFIEYNLHWTHGGRPFDPNDEECIKQLNEWKEKSKVSNYYKVAIETWTLRDTKKAQVAKENKINYMVIYK